MTLYLRWVLETELRGAPDDDLAAIARDLLYQAREEEAGTLQCDVHLSEDGERLHLLMGFSNDTAVVEHLQGFTRRFARPLFALVRPLRMTVYGDPSPEVREALGALQPTYMPRLQDG
ncbi:hypothetical protein [Rhodosalinus sp. K401]|uniref:hypothetical protein n=1 Tax=Rhodosalinus sp. K401 TaxID=3239195 RepID=UPI0035260A1D